ncbi:MAG: 16S rRNA (uracil(1498)-N(3))-methyltransferase [Thermoguttaceae bacterium]|jgi:16S rRNA (uracil1498-N3)-methyltransferase
MTNRYFVESPIVGEQASLIGPEAHHLINVMRARRGATVILFDGSGSEFSARVEQVGRNGIELTVLSREEVDRELPFVLTLGVALPKGDRQKWLVEKAVELGVGRVIPLKTQRAVAQPVQQALDRLRRSVIEASKQCGRNRLMEIAEPLEFSDYIDATRDRPCRLLAHPHGPHSIKNLPHAADVGCVKHTDEHPQDVFLAVGPEGGFTSEEVALATKAGWRTVDLGPRILRIETAALLLVAMVAVGRL